MELKKSCESCTRLRFQNNEDEFKCIEKLVTVLRFNFIKEGENCRLYTKNIDVKPHKKKMIKLFRLGVRKKYKF